MIDLLHWVRLNRLSLYYVYLDHYKSIGYLTKTGKIRKTK